MAEDQKVRVWDKWGKEQNIEDTSCFDSWDLCRREKRFPNGLIQFLSSDTSGGGCGYAAPTPIQSYAWPALLQGMDVIGVAKTGSGKTLAFLLPAFMWLKKNKKSANPVDLQVGPAVLCLTPTRELCFQIYSDAQRFGEPVQITSACCFGGANKREQEWKIREGPHCLIATPGRLNDFCNSNVVCCDMCRFCILDEADRMLDMGFEPQIKQILDRVPWERQTSLFTATWNKEVREIADKYIRDPVVVQIGDDQMTANADITQHIMACKDKDQKKEELDRILEELGEEGNCLVFCNTKRQCRDLCWEFSSGDLKAVELHGDLSQSARDESLNSFKEGEARILIATDLAARGLDIRNCTKVVNWDVPKSQEDYIHRIGRTGRAGDKGDSYTFFNEWGQQKEAENVKACMTQVGQEIPSVLEDLVAGRTPGSGGGGDDDWNTNNNGNENGDEKRVHPSDKGKTAYSYAEFLDFSSGDKAKADKMWNEATPVESDSATAQESSDEKRVHPSDKQGTAYSYAEFLDFSNGDKKKANKMWEEAKPVETEDAHGEKRDAEEDGEQESSPAKKARTDSAELDFDKSMEIDRLLMEGKGSTLTIQQLRKWLGDQGLETGGLKSALVQRAEKAAQDALNA